MAIGGSLQRGQRPQRQNLWFVLFPRGQHHRPQCQPRNGESACGNGGHDYGRRLCEGSEAFDVDEGYGPMYEAYEGESTRVEFFALGGSGGHLQRVWVGRIEYIG